MGMGNGERTYHTYIHTYILRGYAAYMTAGVPVNWYIERYHRRVSKGGSFAFQRWFLDDYRSLISYALHSTVNG